MEQALKLKGDGELCYGDYHVTYQEEDSEGRKLKTLTVSRKDFKRPDFRRICADLPDLKQVFFPNHKISFSQKKSAERGYMLVLVILD